MTELSKAFLGAYEELRALAQRGREFRWNEIRTDRDDNPVFGQGHDLMREVQVPDVRRGRFVTGQASVRVILSVEGNLHLRTRVVWTTSKGGSHNTWALFEFSPEVAQTVAAGFKPEEDEEAAAYATLVGTTPTIAHEDVVRNLASAKLGASWNQIFPGDADHVAEAIGEPTPGKIIRFALSPTGRRMRRLGNYHERAVLALKAEHPDMLAMATESEMGGDVDPQKLLRVRDWVFAQPEAA